MYDGYTKYDEQVASNYDESRQVERHWLREDRFVKRYFASRPVASLLDIPVGTGRFFPHYASVKRVVGVDVSEAMLSQARQRRTLLPPGAEVILERGDVLDLRFADGEFDTALVFRLFHLMPDEIVPQAVRELCRVSARDVVVQTYVPLGRFLRRLVRLSSRFGRKPSEVAEERPWLHITSYNHHQRLFDAEFARNGFAPSVSKRLDIYGHSEVRATVYTKKAL